MTDHNLVPRATAASAASSPVWNMATDVGVFWQNVRNQSIPPPTTDLILLLLLLLLLVLRD